MSFLTTRNISLTDGQTNYEFEGPYVLGIWRPPSIAGLYAIMHLGAESKYIVDYIGETKDFLTRGFPWEHEKSACFIREAGSKELVTIAIHPMPDSSKLERTGIESILVRHWNPSCN